MEKEELGVRATLLIQNTQGQLGPGLSWTPTSRVVPPSEGRTPALRRTLFLGSGLCSPSSFQDCVTGIPSSPPRLSTFLPAAGLNLSRDYIPVKEAMAPRTAPQFTEAGRRKPRAGSAEAGGGGGTPRRETQPPLGRNSCCSPPLQVKEEADLQGRSACPCPKLRVLHPATTTQ